MRGLVSAELFRVLYMNGFEGRQRQLVEESLYELQYCIAGTLGNTMPGNIEEADFRTGLADLLCYLLTSCYGSGERRGKVDNGD